MTNEKSDEGNAEGKETPTPVTPIEKVTENYEALKAANDKVEEELLRGEELRAKAAQGGKSSAGQAVETTDEEKIKAEAEAFLKEDE